MITSTLVVTTYNRAALLARALASIAASHADPTRYEVIVVDNNSSDDTAQAWSVFTQAHPTLPFRYLFEPRQGLSHARNAGLAAARGQHIAFMDDDQEIDAGYLRALPAAFERTGAACLGGRIFYRHADALPPWLTPLIDRIGQIDLGDATLTLGAGAPYLKGGNIAFDTTALRGLGGFDPLLGRNGNTLGAGEEDAVQDQLRGAGRVIAYCPELVQFNVLLPEKLHKRYWRAQAYWGGRSEFQRSHGQWQGAVQWAGAPRALYRSLLSGAGRWAAAVLTLDSVRSFQRERDVRGLLGNIAEARALAAASRAAPGNRP